MLVTIQHKVPDEDTSEIEHDSRFLFDWRQRLAAFYTSSCEWDPCETSIHGTCSESALKLRSPAFLRGSRSLGEMACRDRATSSTLRAGHILLGPYAHNLDQTQIRIYFDGSVATSSHS